MVMIVGGSRNDPIENLANARDDLDDDYLYVGGIRIELGLATAIRELLTMPNRSKPWRVSLSSCSFESEFAAIELVAALFSTACEVEIQEINGSNEYWIAGLDLDSYDNVSAHLKKLIIADLTLVDSITIMLNRILRNATSLEELEIARVDFRRRSNENNAAPARLFEGITHNIKSLRVYFVYSYFLTWHTPFLRPGECPNIEGLEFIESAYCVPNFFNYPNLRSIVIREYEQDDIWADMNLIDYLASPGCMVSTLEIEGGTLSIPFSRELLNAASKCHLLRRFAFQPRTETTEDNVLYKMLLEFLSQNDFIQEIEIDVNWNSGDFDELAAMLEGPNSRISKISGPSLPQNIHALLTRNSFGRRILSASIDTVPHGLWPIILARIHGNNVDLESAPTPIFCADSMYHLIRNLDIGLVFGNAGNGNAELHSTSKRKRGE